MPKKQDDITPEDILAWADGLVGAKVKDTAARFGVARQTIAKRRDRVRKFIADKIDVDQYRTPLYGLYPLILNSLIYNLRKNSETTTLALAKGLQMLVDKQVNENKDTPNLTNDELAERILGIVKTDPSGEGGDPERSDGDGEA